MIALNFLLSWRNTLPLRGARVFLLAAVVCLTACSPRYNWREVQDASGFTATFPARVSHQSGPVSLAGARGTLTLTGAEVGQLSFVVGVVQLDAGADTAKAAKELVNTMAQSLAAAAPQFTSVALAKASFAGSPAPKASVAGEAFEIKGAKAQVFGRIASSPERAIEILVTGPAQAFSDQDAIEARDTFFDSFRLS